MQKSMIIDIDKLIYQAIFANEDLQKKARQQIFKLAEQNGIYSSSILPLYQAFGQEKVKGFTIPAINIRALTYDTARIIFKLMLKHNIGAVVFEIARSEIGYTQQRPEEYTVAVLAAAIKEGYKGPVFLQGDHYQFSKSKFTADKEAEIERVKELVKESLDGQFLNIDIDASTLVDLEQKDLAEQQRNNYEMTALFTEFIRQHQPKDQMVSIGGEIGHIGGVNSTVSDFKAFMQGYENLIKKDGISKVSVQTGSSHGGTVLPDGTIKKVAIDFSVLKDIGDVAKKEYGLGGTVQHGASTLPIDFFDDFANSKTLEVHLATGFQNIVFDSLPQDLQKEMEKYILENFEAEREEGWNDKQFIYKLRKKTFGPFKQVLWEMNEEEKKPVRENLEKQLHLIFSKLNIFNTRKVTDSYFN